MADLCLCCLYPYVTSRFSHGSGSHVCFFLFMCNCLLLCKYVNTVNIYSADSFNRSNFVNTLYKLIMISVVKILAYIFDSYH